MAWRPGGLLARYQSIKRRETLVQSASILRYLLSTDGALIKICEPLGLRGRIIDCSYSAGFEIGGKVGACPRPEKTALK